MSIVAVLASIGAPSLQNFLASRTADAEIAEFTSALRMTKSEALKRGEPVTLCAKLPSADDACAPNSKDWSAGWLVFVDRDSHGVIGPNDKVLRIHQPPASAGPITAGQGSMTFLSTGISAKANTTMRFSPRGAAAGDKAAAGTKIVCVNRAGRAHVSADEAC